MLMLMMLISQEVFDETLLESQELFEYDDEQAVKETISELQSQNAETTSSSSSFTFMDHLSLTHPHSDKGKQDRTNQKLFVQALSEANLQEAMIIVDRMKGDATTTSTSSSTTFHSVLPVFANLILKHKLLSNSSELIQRFSTKDNENAISEIIHFILYMLSEQTTTTTTTHYLVRELKLLMGQTLQEDWFPLFERFPTLRVSLIRFAHVCCNGCESNKKTLVQAGIRYHLSTSSEDPTVGSASSSGNGISMLVQTFPMDLTTDSNQRFTTELCKLISILGKFQASSEPPPQDGQAPVVSSAHANAKEFFKCGVVNKLHTLTNCAIEKNQERILCEILSALRVLAIDNDIVQNMVAVGVLDSINSNDYDRGLLVHQSTTAAATLGLLRNLCANDGIKVTLCKQSLPSILQAMELHAANVTVQEHGCGILAAMSLREPHNAQRICESNGGEYIVKAMKAFANKVSLQRQGCLALRNIASRSSDHHKQVLLDSGAEFVLRQIASRYQESVDEAYAALRDLGCPVAILTVDETGKAQGTQLFGTVKSNFRPVYDVSTS